MNIAYCAECKPPRLIGLNVGLGTVTHKVEAVIHKGKVIDVGDSADDRRKPNESVQGYMDRLGKKYATKLT